ncbi:MAG: aminotransferase class V-fold PLP-dependent enzyme [Pirellulales bacterium]
MVETATIREKLRSQMPITQRYAYLDHAAVAPLPNSAANAIKRFADQATREGDTRWLEWSAAIQRTRKLAGQMIGATDSEIALVSNTTHGIGIVAEGFPWQPGDNVAVPENEFPSNLLPWKNLSRRGVEVRLVPVAANGALTVEAISNCIDQKTRIVSVSWVGFSSGFRCDLKAISQLVHDRGCLFFVDAIQGLGAFPIDVQCIDIDFLAADGHKWMLGPEGAGVLFIKEPHLDRLATIGIGWASLAAAGFDPKSVQLKPSAAKFEGGSSNMVGMMALGESLSLLHELGAGRSGGGFDEVILENVLELSELLHASGFQSSLPEAVENRSGILGVRWPEADQVGEAAYLNARKFLLGLDVVVSVRGGRLRAATHAYNDRHDHQRLVDGLVQFRSHA